MDGKKNSALAEDDEAVGEVNHGAASNSVTVRQPHVVVGYNPQRGTHDSITSAQLEPTVSRLFIGPYAPMSAEYLPYNSESPKAAAWIIESIEIIHPCLKLEHIGSSAVPGCWGKGIIDLLIQYPSGALEAACGMLDRLGFQHQNGAERFAEPRPMRVGSVEYFGRRYRIHAHVTETGSCEARDLLLFRDLLRRDNTVRQAYVSEKRATVSRGITKSAEYSKAKGEFIHHVLSANK